MYFINIYFYNFYKYITIDVSGQSFALAWMKSDSVTIF